MTTPTIPTLADLDARYAGRMAQFGGLTRQWDRYTLQTSHAIGAAGSSYRGRTGSHTHLLRVETIVAETEHRPGTMKVGDRFSVHSLCTSSRGQHGGIVREGDTDQVTCSKCLGVLQSFAVSAS